MNKSEAIITSFIVATTPARLDESDKIAVNLRTALKMFWDAGWDDEKSLLAAADIINKLKQTTPGYWKAEDISAALAKNKK
jgi:hypothetical protein